VEAGIDPKTRPPLKGAKAGGFVSFAESNHSGIAGGSLEKSRWREILGKEAKGDESIHSGCEAMDA